MINFDDITWEKLKEHNPNWRHISGNPYKILIIGGFGSGKTKELLNLNRHTDLIKYIYILRIHISKIPVLN